MRCPHCNQEHPDGFQFCPSTGKKIDILRACTNKNCPDCGKNILPLDSLFCPICGFKLEDDNRIKGNNSDKNKKKFMVKGCSFNMVRVRKGMFMMGAPKGENDASEKDKPAHVVELTNDYYIGEIPVTQNLWMAVMGNNPSHNKGENMPVENITWNDCQNFICLLNNLTGENFRLPTEAEWEFAARGGINSNHTRYSGSDDINIVAWDQEDTYPVAEKQPNELGIYDMCGNVYEWCADWYGEYSAFAQKNPICKNPISLRGCVFRVTRGGKEWYFHHHHTVFNRGGHQPESRKNDVGFRLCLSDLNSTNYEMSTL